MSDKIRVGVVGLGYWGPNLVRNLFELPEAEVACVCDSRLELIQKLRRRYPAVTSTTQFGDLLADESIDAIVLATPVSTHYELARRSIEAGKHVLVEKPLATSTAEAVELSELARQQGVVLMPGHTFLYSPPVNVIRELINSGDLGDIYFISTSRVNLGLHQSDVSVAWDLGPHDFSILRYWLGETPSHVTALMRACVFPTTPDVAFINLEYPSGTIAHVELSWLAPSKLRRTTIIGARKMVVYDDASIEPVRLFDTGVMLPDPESFGEYKLTYRTGDIISPRVEASEPLLLEVADFCNAIATGETPRSSDEIGMEVVRMVEAVDSSLANGGVRVEVPPARTVVD